MQTRVPLGALLIDAGFLAMVVEEAFDGSRASGELFWTGFARLIDVATDPARLDTAPAGDIHPERRSNGPQLRVRTGDPALGEAGPARWCSLGEALPTAGTPIADAEGRRRAHLVLDAIAPMRGVSHAEAVTYRVGGGQLVVRIEDGSEVPLRDPGRFTGHAGDPACPSAIVLRRDGLHAILTVGGNLPPRIEIERLPVVAADSGSGAGQMPDVLAGWRGWFRLARANQGVRWQTPAMRLRTAPSLMLRASPRGAPTLAVSDAAGAGVPAHLLDLAAAALAAHATGAATMPMLCRGLRGIADLTQLLSLCSGLERLLDRPPGTLRLGLTDDSRQTSLAWPAMLRLAAPRLWCTQPDEAARLVDEIDAGTHVGPLPGPRALAASPLIEAFRRHHVGAAAAAGLSPPPCIVGGEASFPGRAGTEHDDLAAAGFDSLHILTAGLPPWPDAAAPLSAAALLVPLPAGGASARDADLATLAAAARRGEDSPARLARLHLANWLAHGLIDRGALAAALAAAGSG